ncbi:MAG: hypothetical protein AB7I48_28345, partial [Planctomycetaceae bacterium]
MRKRTSTTTTIPASGSSPRRAAGEVSEPIDAEVLEFRAQFEERMPLDELVRTGAQRMLQAAMDAEVEAFVAAHADR